MRLHSDAPEEFRYTVLALQRQGARRLNQILSPLGLTNSQAEVVEVVGDFGPMTTRSVGQHLICESGSPSRLLTALARKGLIVRSRPEGDNRSTLHALSPAGREVLSEVRRIQNEFTEGLRATLTEVQQQHPEDRMRQLAELVVDPELRSSLNLRFPELYGEGTSRAR